jgi:hypothetical protein
LRCKYRHTDNGNCTAVGGFCTAVPAAHCPLLREYLDTELTPQEVLSMKFEWCAMMDALNSIGGGYTRLRELAEADRNHQIVIRPCKIGDTVWAADMEPVIPLHVMADAVYLEGRHGGDYERLSNFGSVVFLSQEEAKEAASHWMK